MKSIIPGLAVAALLMIPAAGQAQRSGSDTIDRNGRSETGTARLSEKPSHDLRHGEQNPMPGSAIPRRSPDLGEPSFPLSPSIGPGSGLLGPEAGRGPARLRSGAGTGSGPGGANDGR
jgi:hypothetical protein